MAKFRNVSSDRLLVGYGTPRRWVDPDGVIDVADEVADAYEQPGTWEPMSAPSKKTKQADEAGTEQQ